MYNLRKFFFGILPRKTYIINSVKPVKLVKFDIFVIQTPG